MTVRAILSDLNYARLKAHVLNRTGLAYYDNKDEDFAARLSRRFGALKISNCAAYFEILDRDGAGISEIDALVGELTIGETYFFRQSEHFELLRSTIIPDLLHRNRDRRQLRIWSAGCATGAEPYSLTMLLQSEFPDKILDWQVLILGTDINVEFLAQARTGSFSEWALREVPTEGRACFVHDGKRWILNREFREAVTFRYHNLADDQSAPTPDGGVFDLILCRNVMIYFSEERTRAVGAKFFKHLDEGGYLLVGHAESSWEMFRQFELVHQHNVMAYRKPSQEAPQNVEALGWLPWQDANFVIPAGPLAENPPVATHLPLPSLTLPPSNLQDARILADRGEWKQAEAICRSVLESDVLNGPAYFTLGLVLAQIDTPAAAMAELRRAIYVNRQFALAYYHLGTLLQANGSASEARRAFRNVIEILDSRPGEEPVEHGDGIKVAELRDLTRMHQEVLEQ